VITKKKENIDSCWMIGHSMGGYITLAFAEKFPGELKGLGLFHSTVYADDEEKKGVRLKNIEFIKKYGSAKFLEQAIRKCIRFHDGTPSRKKSDSILSASAAARAEPATARYIGISPS
jgi:pimeloyl-ACP methyl ester carboxylesterase